MSINNQKITIGCWNVNGLRALHKKGAWQTFLQKTPCDIVCIQETKCHPDQLTDEIKTHNGYMGYFSWSKIKKGYSGVAVYTKQKPLRVTVGIHDDDPEGRTITLFFKDWVLVNCYFPNGGSGEHRINYKLDFYKRFLNHVESLQKKYKTVLWCGDINTAHMPIDLARPKENQNNTGFLPIERAWLDAVAKKSWIDIWRHMHPQKIQYTYWDQKTGARLRNVGWRIDYFFIHQHAFKHVQKCFIDDTIIGSDHCPLYVTISL